nr:MFS transporter [Roseospira goensis]
MLIAALCAAEVLTMIGVFAFAALLPAFMAAWDLSSTEAGWIGGIVFAGYAVAAPVLVALTDRVDARRVFVGGALLAGGANLAFAVAADGFWSALLLRALAGVGLAGTYMPGLRVLVDRLPPARRPGAVPLYTASFSLGSAVSYLIPALVADLAGWRTAFAVAGLAAVAATALLVWLPRHRPEPPADGARGALLDFRPVFASRATMGYVLGYVAHMWELFAFRAWIVAFLGFGLAAGATGPADAGGTGLLAPGSVATWGALVAMAASIGGARVATRRGRAATTQVFMAASALMALGFGWCAGLPYPVLAGLAILYAGLIQLDSAALTTGAVETAPAGRRGATLAVHSLLGFGAAFLGPLLFGLTLDLAGGRDSAAAWGVAFALVGGIGLLGIPALALARGRPRTARGG